MGLLTKEQYRVQLEETKKWLEDSIKINRELAGRNSDLEAELAEARRDSARLDWIELHSVKVESRVTGFRSLDPWLVNAGESKSDAVTGQTLRSTIDTAMKEPT